MTPADALVAAARGYAGVPFRHLGRGRAGIDCVGLLLAAAADAGVPTDDPGRYARGHRGRDMIAWLGERLDRVRPPTAHRDGDVLVFTDEQMPCHVGLRSTLHGVAHVVHAHVARNAVVEEQLAWHLADQHLATFRLREG